MEACARILVFALFMSILTASGGAWAEEKSSPAAAPSLRWKSVETDGFRAEIPEDWQPGKVRKLGPAAHIGLWAYRSANRDYRLRIRIAEGQAGDFAKAAEENFARLRARLSEPKVLKKEITQEDGRDVFYAFVQGLMVRKDYMRPYLVYRLMASSKRFPLRVTITIAAAEGKLPAVASIVERFMDKFKLRGPEVRKPAEKPVSKSERR